MISFVLFPQASQPSINFYNIGIGLFILSSFSIILSLLLLIIFVVFPSPLPPQFYCFPSPPPPRHFYFVPPNHSIEDCKLLLISSFCSIVSCSEEQSWFSSTVSCLSSSRPNDTNGSENVKNNNKTTTTTGLMSRTTKLHVQHTFFVHFFAVFAVFARLKRQNA